MYCILFKNDSLLWILRFPGYFKTPLFRTSFHFPWGFEIAGFDCIMIIAELSGRCRQSTIVLGGEGQSLGTKDTLSIGPLDTHWSHVFINPVRSIFRQMPGHFATRVNPGKHRESPTPATTNREHCVRIFCTKVFFQSSKQLKQLLQKLKHDQHGIT